MKKRLATILTILMTFTNVAAQTAKNELLRVDCVDGEGKPIAGVEVHVWQNRPRPDGSGKMEMAGPFVSDASGITNTVVALTFDGGRFDRWVYARVPNKLVGAVRDAIFTKTDTINVTRPIKVQLLPSRTIQGRIALPQGMDATKVRVRAISLTGIIGDNVWAQVFPRQTGIASLRHTLPERFEAGVNQDGSFVFADMPQLALVYLAAEGHGLAQAQWCNARLPGRAIPESFEITMQPQSVLAGTVLQPDGQPCRDAEVALQIQSVENAWVRDTFLVNTDALGIFKIAGLPAGEFSLAIKSDAGLLRPVLTKLAHGESRLSERLQLEVGVEVRGVVVESAGSKPVEGVHVTAISDDPQHTRLGHSRSDALGRFAMRLPSGVAKIYFNGIPDGFAYPEPQILLTLDIDKPDPELTQIVLQLSRK